MQLPVHSSHLCVSISKCPRRAAAVSQNSRKAVVQQTFSRIFFCFFPPSKEISQVHMFRIQTLCKMQSIIWSERSKLGRVRKESDEIWFAQPFVFSGLCSRAAVATESERPSRNSDPPSLLSLSVLNIDSETLNIHRLHLLHPLTWVAFWFKLGIKLREESEQVWPLTFSLTWPFAGFPVSD